MHVIVAPTGGDAALTDSSNDAEEEDSEESKVEEESCEPGFLLPRERELGFSVYVYMKI